jgi:hypothetical protein
MLGATVTATQVIGNVERDILMLPSHPQPSTSKRKTEDDSNPLTNAAKRLKVHVSFIPFEHSSPLN